MVSFIALYRWLRLGCLLACVAATGCEKCEPVRIEPSSLPQGTVGKRYRQELAVACYDGGWSLRSGDLPPGIQFNNKGVFTGTPVLAGTYAFTVGIILDESSDDHAGTDLSSGYILVISDSDTDGGASGAGGSG
jgi:hypothetical protein